MKTTIVFNHPYDGSFCTALLGAATAGLTASGHTVDLIHLDKDGFNPVMSTQDLQDFRNGVSSDPQVRDYQQRIAASDHLVFVFPIWWELMPALTKGFIDRVVAPGAAYAYTNDARTRMAPLWTGLRSISVITTMNTPAWLYWLVFGNAIQRALIRGTFWKLGYKNLKWTSFNAVKQTTPAQRERWLRDVEASFAALKP